MKPNQEDTPCGVEKSGRRVGDGEPCGCGGVTRDVVTSPFEYVSLVRSEQPSTSTTGGTTLYIPPVYSGRQGFMGGTGECEGSPLKEETRLTENSEKFYVSRNLPRVNTVNLITELLINDF